MRLPTFRRNSSSNPDDFRARQERRLLQAKVSDYCGQVRFRNFRRLMASTSLLVLTIVGCVAEIDSHSVGELITHLIK